MQLATEQGNIKADNATYILMSHCCRENGRFRSGNRSDAEPNNY